MSIKCTCGAPDTFPHMDTCAVKYAARVETLKVAGDAVIDAKNARIAALEAERDRAREALDALMFEAKVYAAHNKLEPLAQRMYDIAEAALATLDRGGEHGKDSE